VAGVNADAAVRTARAGVEGHRGEIEYVLLDDETVETDVGWVFFWTSRRFVETGDLSDAVAGNGPLLVDRRDGSLHQLWSGESWETGVERYRQTGRALPPELGPSA
jgi:hypothetical protein